MCPTKTKWSSADRITCFVSSIISAILFRLATPSFLIIILRRLDVTTEKYITNRGVRLFFLLFSPLPFFHLEGRLYRDQAATARYADSGDLRTRKPPSSEWILPVNRPRSRESALAETIYSLGSPFATLEPLILPVDREILEGTLTARLRHTRVASLLQE